MGFNKREDCSKRFIRMDKQFIIRLTGYGLIAFAIGGWIAFKYF